MVSRLRLLLAALATVTLATCQLMAEPIGLMEKYALSVDRDAMLAELIPGSEDYFFYHCLHYQTVGQLDRSEAIIKDWLAEHKGRETPVIQGMLDRQRLLTYNESPARTIDYLVKRLGVQHQHAPPVVKGERRFPSELDATALTVDRLVKEALQRNGVLKPIGIAHLAELFRSGKTAGLTINLHEFLQRVDGPYIDGLDQLVIKELSARKDKDKKFGDLPAHRFLTLAELDRVADQVPQVADDNAFVSAKLNRLRPDGDSDLNQQPGVRREYLTRVARYVHTLPPAYNSLAACADYRLLEANLAANSFSLDLFLRYLQLPRTSPIVHPEWARRPVLKAQLNHDFMEMALMPPVGDEQPLVRAYLEHFLEDADNTDAFDQYLRGDYLRRVFAETKLLSGVGDQEQWYKMLSASQRQAIRDSIELRLAPTNKIRFGADDLTGLNVDIKNIDELVVRIYEINTLSYYRTHDKPIDTDIDLDGLIATHETKLNYNQPPVERHREFIELKEITGRGVWIVDLVGNGMRARALVRRGEIDHIDSTDADGMVFTIIDENRVPIPAATMLVGSQELLADEAGRIRVPPVIDQVDRRTIISDGKIAQQVRFRHLREQYQLVAGMHLDRTQLQSGGTTQLLVRPRVTMSGQIIDPATLTDVSVRIQATDLENLTTTVQLEQLQLDQNAELVVPLRVPARLANLNVTLSGVVEGLADSRQQTLQTSRSWDIAGIRRTNHTHDSFLTRDGDKYVIEVRGRTGERISGATVTVSLQTKASNAPVEQTLQSDDHGNVQLSTLSGVTHIRYGVPSGLQHERDLRLDRVVWPNEVHTTSDRTVQLPLAQSITSAAERYRLLEVRGGDYHIDRTDQLSIDSGFLAVKPLTAGDYHLVNRSGGERTQITVVDGPALGLVAAGRVRHRSLAPNSPLGVASIDQDESGLTIRLSGDASFARVHVFASRYLDATDPLSQLALPLPRLFGRNVSLPRCGYISDLRLGDEYQYVLRRRYAAKYAGVMLPRPSVILNPWETEETTNSSQTAKAGEAPMPSAMAVPPAKKGVARQQQGRQAQTESSDFDFLADAGALLSNLRADEDGLVRIPADVIKGLPLLQIVISDGATLLQRIVTTPLEDAQTVDLRLSKALDADQPLSFERAVMVASKDEPLDLKSLGSAQIQVYGSVGALFKLYKTLIGDTRLADFDELASWHKLDRGAKLDAYSRLASHELHLFLWSHDRTFFKDIVQPYLSNKKEKQFVDQWLLEYDLTRYTKLWQYNQLNAAERALLAMRLPDVRDSIRRELKETVAQQDANHLAIRKQIESALLSDTLSADFDGAAVMLGGSVADAFGAIVNDAEESLVEREALSGVARDLGRRRYNARSDKAKQAEQANEAKLQSSRKRNLNLFSRRGALSGAHYGFYRELDSTKQWAESQWDRVRTVSGPPPASLISIDPFWADLANGDRSKVRVSPHLLRPVGNRHSALLALAMCGLPLSSGDIGLPTEADQSYAPEHPVAIVTKRLKHIEAAEQESSILVGQRFASLEQATHKENVIAEPSEFLIGVGYRGQTVISNPTSQQRIVDVFWQIPAGSLPLGGSQKTDSRTVTLEPFAVQAIEYQFYFPMVGEFTHYPATIAADGKLLSRGSEKTFKVVEQASKDDSITWAKIARTGSPQQIEQFLTTTNLRAVDWMLVAHRMHDQEVYRVIIKTLGAAHLSVNELLAYSLLHRDEDTIRDYLSLRDDLVDRVGPVLKSPLLDVEPIERRTHEHLEYAPLVRARIHRLGDENEILNSTFLGQYRSFVRMLGFREEVPAEEQLVLAYYLLLQNRIEDATRTFAKLDRDSIATKLQYDYLDAYLALHREQFDLAGRIAAAYVEHPIERWKNRFGEIASQLQQRQSLSQTEKLVSADKKTGNQPIAEGTGDLAVMDRERRQADATESQPEVIVRVEGSSLRIDHRRAKKVTVNLYGVDLELLFSKAPFVREDLKRMAMVRPVRSDAINFEDPTGVGQFQLDENLSRQTLLVEVVAGGSRSTALYYGGEITTYVSESFGQLQTTDSQTHQPISTAYVKVYAKYPNGKVQFYKDGYTDSRGRFDYASISASEARGAIRFAILVISEEKGATLHDVATPEL